MKLVDVPCPVCTDTDYKVLYPDMLGTNPPVFGYKWTPEICNTYRIVKCNACGHVYSNPRLENMYQYYKDVIDRDYLKNSDLRMQTAKAILPAVLKIVPSGRLLDVGCSTGDFLSVAEEYYEVEGLELSKWAFDIAKQRGLLIHTKKLDEMNDADSKYDIITMWGVIEHLEYPRVELRHVNRLLNNGGIVCFWTGDSNSIYHKLLRGKWWYLLGQHIQFFNKKSLDRLMNDAGFSPVYKGIYPYVMSLKYLGISLSRYPLIGSLARKLFKIFRLEKRKFILKKSDEMFAIYRKHSHIDT